MIVTIFTAIITFIATGLDEMFILTVLFTQAKGRNSINQIYAGQMIGMVVLLSITTLAVYGFHLINTKWIGLLGIIPIFIGLRIWLKGDDDDEDELITKSYKYNSLLLSVAFIAIAGGAEELAIYIPYFAALHTTEIIIAWITFLLLVPVWCTLCKKVSKIKQVENHVEKYERVLVPIVFVGLGIYVLIENRTFLDFINL